MLLRDLYFLAPPILINCFVNTKNGKQNRPEACTQVFGAEQHDDKRSYEHKERYTKIGLKLVYKHLVHNIMMRNSLINPKNGKQKPP